MKKVYPCIKRYLKWRNIIVCLPWYQGTRPLDVKGIIHCSIIWYKFVCMIEWNIYQIMTAQCWWFRVGERGRRQRRSVGLHRQAAPQVCALHKLHVLSTRHGSREYRLASSPSGYMFIHVKQHRKSALFTNFMYSPHDMDPVSLLSYEYC